DVQKEFQDGDALVGEHPFKVVDQAVALTPDLFRHQLVHAHDQNIFIVAAVEDCDLSLSRGVAVNAPEKVMVKFFRRWRFKTSNPNSLGIDARKYMADSAVLAAGVHGL